MKIANNDIRTRAKEAGVRHWQIAERYHIDEGNFSRKLRHELPQEEKEKIFRIIDELKAGD